MWLPGGAFENEMDVQAPVDFVDPVGFCSEADTVYRPGSQS